MNIRAYQFIKYNNSTLREHIDKVIRTGAVICFDFEDGIINPLNINSSASIKDKAREQFVRVSNLIKELGTNIEVGVRINLCNTSEFNKDLKVLKNQTFHSIFLPKVENLEDIKIANQKLMEYNIQYKELIPIIESHNGLLNLEAILQSNSKIKKIGFGHCDYNLSIGAYPFFHQDSWEYWKWIAEIELIIKRYKVLLINSVYLNLKNEVLFCSMIEYIAITKRCFHGQFTLSNRQSELCNHRYIATKKFRRLLENNNLISIDIQIAYDLVKEFEIHNHGNALTNSNNRLISLQEYLASKNLLNDKRPKKEICFVGGCFPVQHDIIYENLFHQILKRTIENKYQCRVNINIIRYERFSSLLSKIDNLASIRNLDLIIFHVRPEPYLRLIKLLYKYLDDTGKLKWSINLPYLKILKSEDFDMLEIGRLFSFRKQLTKSLFRKLLISGNYLLGKLIGNHYFALKSYWKTTSEIIEFCDINKINFLILGPNRRSNNLAEPLLCSKLDQYLSSRVNSNNYISGFEVDNKARMNQENGIHVTQSYHDLIADKLYKSITSEELLQQEILQQQDR